MSASPAEYARAFAQFLGLRPPFELDYQTLLKIGLDLREVPAQGFDGALLRRPGEARGIIAIRDTIAERESEKFTIAHEIAHYIMPGHDVDRSVCTSDDVGFLRNRAAEIEQAANEFAAELLLPAGEIRRIINSRGASMETSKVISKTFKTSLTTAAARCVELTESNAALVETVNGIRYRFQKSDNWNYYIRRNEPLDPRSLAKQLSSREKEKQGRVPAAAWASKSARGDFLEHSILMARYDVILTFLTEP